MTQMKLTSSLNSLLRGVNKLSFSHELQENHSSHSMPPLAGHRDWLSALRAAEDT